MQSKAHGEDLPQSTQREIILPRINADDTDQNYCHRVIGANPGICSVARFPTATPPPGISWAQSSNPFPAMLCGIYSSGSLSNAPL
jgi:hypothetical protein